jgi:flagellar protein FliS
MTTARHAINAYVQTGIETGVPEADSHRLVQMLFEGAIAAIAAARIKLARGDIPGRGEAISKAISIIEQGLRGSLDLEKGGDIGARLEALYGYIISRLLHANLHGEAKSLDEAGTLLGELQSAWVQIAPAQSAPAAVRA